MCEYISSSSESELSQPQEEITVVADVHAEPIASPSPSSALFIPSATLKMLFKETRAEINEIFSIPDNISFQQIAKNLDYYKIKEKTQTPNSSDTELADDWNDFSPQRSKQQNPSDPTELSQRSTENSMLVQIADMDKIYETQKKCPKRVWPYPEREERYTKSKMSKSCSDDDDDGESVQDENILKQSDSIQDVFWLEINRSEHRRSPLSEANHGDIFEMIKSTASYEKGKMMPKPTFSYRQNTNKFYTKKST